MMGKNEMKSNAAKETFDCNLFNCEMVFESLHKLRRHLLYHVKRSYTCSEN